MGREEMETGCEGSSLEKHGCEGSREWEGDIESREGCSYNVWMPRESREEEVGISGEQKGHRLPEVTQWDV